MLQDRTTPADPHPWTAYDAEAALGGLTALSPGQQRVIGQLGQSLDGRIATPTGASKYINGGGALGHLHLLRASVDAVVVGVGTALADDPRLTTRLVEGPNPARVVVDPNGRLTDSATMLSDGLAPVLVATAPGGRVPRNAERLEVPCHDGRMHPGDILSALSGRGHCRVLVEGGAFTLARFMDAGALDELHLMVAPIVLGSGKTGLNLSPIDGLDEALRPEIRTMRFADGDMLAICRLGRSGEDEDAT